MVKLLGVGDNTVDRYIHLNRMFPGGNTVNVAVLAKRYGHEAAYVGWLGNDLHGRLLFNSLKHEGVDVPRVRVIDGPNSYCEVHLVSGERVFGESTSGVSKLICLEKDDYEYISQFDVAHTSVYSFIEGQIQKLSAASKLLSFDFSDNWSREYLREIIPYVDIAFLSAPGKYRKEASELIRWVYERGPELVVITQGDQGSLIYSGTKVHHQAIVKTQVVDTLGAGDAFAARLLVEYLSGTPLEESMIKASISASETCKYYGAWGHGAPLWSLKKAG